MNTQPAYTAVPVTIPFTMRPNAIYGYHYKYWIAPIALLTTTSIVLMHLFVPSVAWLVTVLLPLGLIPTSLIIGYNMKTKYITLHQDSIEVKNGAEHFTIPFSQLVPVRRGIIGAGATPYAALYIASTAEPVHYTPSALFWTKKDLRSLYAAIPEQHRDLTANPTEYLIITAPPSAQPKK